MAEILIPITNPRQTKTVYESNYDRPRGKEIYTRKDIVTERSN